MNELYNALALFVILIGVIIILSKMGDESVGLPERLTLEITEFSTSCGNIKYHGYIPELGCQFVEVVPIGFKPIFEDILISKYGLNIERLYSISIDENAPTPLAELQTSLREKQDCDIKLMLDKTHNLGLKVVFKAPKHYVNLGCVA